ncbi:MAG: hypothetical protein VB091_15035 [Christensenella sp.]|nr:hypothetical protein [Christensenella sp.]
MKRFFSHILPHAVIVLSLMTLTFFGIDRVNPIMAFMTSELSKWVFALLAVTGFATAVLLIGMQWSEDDRKARRALKQKAQTSAVESTESADDEPKDA